MLDVEPVLWGLTDMWTVFTTSVVLDIRPGSYYGAWWRGPWAGLSVLFRHTGCGLPTFICVISCADDELRGLALALR